MGMLVATAGGLRSRCSVRFFPGMAAWYTKLHERAPRSCAPGPCCCLRLGRAPHSSIPFTRLARDPCGAERARDQESRSVAACPKEAGARLPARARIAAATAFRGGATISHTDATYARAPAARATGAPISTANPKSSRLSDLAPRT
jgi:hypothetical protein